jgi:hypothetical protein
MNIAQSPWWRCTGAVIAAALTLVTSAADVRVELMTRGQVTLLTEELSRSTLPPGQQRLLLDVARLVLDSLGRGPGAALDSTERSKLLAALASGAEVAAAEKIDPELAEQVAAVIIARLVEPRLSVLEYWEQDGTVRRRISAEVAPSASAAIALLQSAEAQWQARSEALAAKITTVDSPEAAMYEQVLLRQRSASYTRWMAEYARLLTMAPTDARRAATAKQAIDALQEFSADGSGVEAVVRGRIGKYWLLAGDAAAATAALNSAATSGGAAAQQYDARYFLAVAALKAGDIPAARRKLAELRTFAADKFATANESVTSGLRAAEWMLEYRLETASDNDVAARSSLVKLVTQRPDLAELVQAQLLEGIKDGDLRTVDTDVLLMLARAAMSQRAASSADAQASRQQMLARGIAACDEILRRSRIIGAEAAISAESQREALLIRGQLMAAVSDSPAAVTAMLDFIERYPDHPDAPRVLDTASGAVARLRANAQADKDIDAAYGRLLALAVGRPFDRQELRYEYGRWLLTADTLGPARYRNAMEQFSRVPKTDSNYHASILSRLIVAKQWLENAEIKLSPTDKAALVKLTSDLATQLEADRAPQRAAGWLLASDVARRHGTASGKPGDPRTALAMLDRVDTSIASGLPRSLVSQVLSLRVSLLMELGENQAAGQAVLGLLALGDGSAQADVLIALLGRLEADMAEALSAGDAAKARQMARQRTELAAGLAVSANANSATADQARKYRLDLFHAEAARAEAGLVENADARKASAQQALQMYDLLAAPELQRRWQQATGRTGADPLVDMGQAVLRLQLGVETDASRQVLAKLLEGRLLGSAMIEAPDGGLRPNSRWWDATLALYEANTALALATSDTTAKANLLAAVRRLYVVHGQTPGGALYAGRVARLLAMLES